MKAENRKGCPQRESVEREEYAGVQSTRRREGVERNGVSDLLERILDRNNLNRAYKRVKCNHGAPGMQSHSS
ncbi:MAG: reverse transcriptase [Clostridia bacterium]